MKRISAQPDAFTGSAPALSARQLRIVHILYRFDHGGLENGLINLINHLPADQYHHHIICLTDFNPAFCARIQRPEVRVEGLHKPPGRSLAYLARLRRRLRELQPDIVHTRNLATLECQLAARWAGVAQRIHGEHGWDSPADLQRLKPALIRRLFSPLVGRYVTLSGEASNYLSQRVGIAGTRISRICNGVDTERFHPAQHAPAPATPRRLVIGCVGRLAAVKNHALLLHALAELLQHEPVLRNQVELRLIGDGPEAARLAQLCDELQLGTHCRLLGACDDIPEQMRQFDLFVQPSLAEGISNTILEAMASGLPVISTAVGGAAELIEDGVSGQLVNNDDRSQLSQALARYLRQPALIAQQGAAARQRTVTEFSIEGMVARYHALYQQMIQPDR